MALSFPKHVVIVNQRLSLFYYFWMSVMFVLLTVMFFGFEQYSKEIPLAGHVQVNLWPTGLAGPGAVERIMSTALENFQKPFCQRPQDFDFWWDASWKYTNHTCASFCVTASQTDCLSSLDTFIGEGPSQILLTTQIEKTFVPKVVGGSAPETQRFFVPTTEALSVGFAYSFDLPLEKVQTSRMRWLLGSWQWLGPKTLTGSSSENVLTVTVDDQGKPIKAVRPSSSSPVLSVSDLLTMAGKPNGLDSFAGHENAMPNAAHKAGPLTRISGATLALEVNCYESHRGDIAHLLEGSWDGPACYVGVRDGNKWYSWSSATRREAAEDTAGAKGENLYLYHGLRVIGKGDGMFKVIDINNIYLNIVSFMVLMGLPKALILFFTITFLGHFSKIYKGVIEEEFSIVEQVGGMATRLMSNSATFVDLEASGSDGGGSGITKGRMRERLRESLKHRGGRLDRDEVESFVNFCFRAVSSNNIGKKRIRPSKSFLLGALGASETDGDDVHKDHIDIDCFSKACASLDKIRFEAVVKLFDRDRRVRFLESVFMPPYMRKYLSEVDEARAVSDEILDLEKSVSQQGSEFSLGHHGSEPCSNIFEALGFEKADACEKGAAQPTVPRVPSVELTGQLSKHLETFSKMVEAGELQRLTLEQRRNLPPLMLEALRDVITRGQVTHHRVRDEGRRLEEFESQLEEIKLASTEQIPEKLKAVEHKLQEHMTSVQAAEQIKEGEIKAEHNTLRIPMASLQASVESLRHDLSRCQEELVRLQSISNRPSEPPKGQPPPIRTGNILQGSGSSSGMCCSARKPRNGAT